jgi:hypothetical protein
VAIAALSAPAFDLPAFVERLHPKVRGFCLALADGADVAVAANEAGLTQDQVAKILPRLQSALLDEMQ